MFLLVRRPSIPEIFIEMSKGPRVQGSAHIHGSGIRADITVSYQACVT